MIIDFHVHAFPDALAAKALPLLSKCSGGVKPNYDATISGLESYLAKNNVDYAVVLNIATNPHQEKKVNDFAISLLEKKNIIPFGSVHPDSPNALSELERLAKAGIRGIKLHPDYQHFFVDDEKMFPIYKKIAELGFITVFHAGVDIGYPKPVHCTPERLLRVLDLFDDAPVVAAHFGGWLLWDSVLEDLCGTKVYLDTAFSSGKMPPDYAKELIPWSDTLDEVRFVQSLDLSAEDEEKILSNNAKRLLNI